MQIYDNRAVLLRVRNPQQILNTIPKSKQLPDGRIAVNWGLEEMQVLKNIGVKQVPSPINRSYGWPGLYTPFAHQRTTAEFLTLNRRAFCFSQQGSGKTAAAAWAADYLITAGVIQRVLVVCPLSIMDVAWRSDFFKTVMHRKVDIAHGNAAKRKAVIEGDAEFVVTNYDTVVNSLEDLKYGRFDLIICDEATYLKNVQTKRWKALKQLVGPDTWLWMMTGTPAAQSPEDAYGLAKLVNPNGVPKYFTGFRDLVMYKLTQFKYIPRPDSKNIVHEALQPAIRFTKAECMDLPDMVTVKRRVELTAQQAKYYSIMKKKMVIEAAGEQVTAVNAAVKLGKLLQISCIAGGTPVLTRRGWVPIETVTPTDTVWDGEEWVAQKGAIYKGNKSVVVLAGVQMTPDHKVWVGEWVTAKEIIDELHTSGFTRQEVRLPDGFAQSTCARNQGKDGQMGMPVRLRDSGYSAESVFESTPSHIPPQLRVPPRERKPQDEQFTPVFDMEQNEIPLHEKKRQGLEKLRGAWDCGVQSLATVLREFLGGYARGVQPGAYVGPGGCKRELREVELPVGYDYGAVQQHPPQHPHSNAKGGDDTCRSGTGLRAQAGNPVREAEPVRVVSGRRVAPTFDLRECGPRSRFVVKGEEGQLLIVHNCGAAYSENGETVEFDISSRYNVLMEVINETENKVLIFAPFRSIIEILSSKLNADGITAEIINGGVSASNRTDIFQRFQTTDSPRVLVIQPQAAAHGVTLTAADTVVWWGPTSSVEIYEQANARVHRAGQKNKCTVVQLQGSEAEAHVFSMLHTKVNVHSAMIDLYKKVLA